MSLISSLDASETECPKSTGLSCFSPACSNARTRFLAEPLFLMLIFFNMLFVAIYISSFLRF